MARPNNFTVEPVCAALRETRGRLDRAAPALDGRVPTRPSYRQRDPRVAEPLAAERGRLPATAERKRYPARLDGDRANLAK